MSIINSIFPKFSKINVFVANLTHSLLHKAIEKNFLTVVRCMLCLPIDFNRKYNGQTPLQHACNVGNDNIVKELLKVQDIRNHAFNCYQSLKLIMKIVQEKNAQVSEWYLEFLKAFKNVDVNNLRIAENVYDSHDSYLLDVLVSEGININNFSISVEALEDKDIVNVSQALAHPNCKIKNIEVLAVPYASDIGVELVNNIISVASNNIKRIDMRGLRMFIKQMKNCMGVMAQNLNKNKIAEFFLPLSLLSSSELNEINTQVVDLFGTKNQSRMLTLLQLKNQKFRGHNMFHKFPTELFRCVNDMAEDRSPLIKLQP